MKIIGLSGHAGSGKDEFAEAIVREYHPDWACRSSSDALYSEVSFGFSVSESLLRNRGTKDAPQPEMTPANCDDPTFREIMFEYSDTVDDHTWFSPRVVLQLWGTDYRREMYSDGYWLDRLNEECKKLRSQGCAGVVFPSVRFENEREWLKANGGVHVLIERPGYGPINTYVSESIPFADKVDVLIENDGTLQDLRIHALGVVDLYEHLRI